MSCTAGSCKPSNNFMEIGESNTLSVLLNMHSGGNSGTRPSLICGKQGHDTHERAPAVVRPWQVFGDHRCMPYRSRPLLAKALGGSSHGFGTRPPRITMC